MQTIAIPYRLVRSGDLSMNALALYGLLLRLGPGKHSVTNGRLADALVMTRATVASNLATLADAGLVSVEQLIPTKPLLRTIETVGTGEGGTEDWRLVSLVNETAAAHAMLMADAEVRDEG